MNHIRLLPPAEIEKKSFEIITQELGDRTFPPGEDLVVKRVIHATADFDYADHLVFSNNAVKLGMKALREGLPVFTDTNMAKAGINKKALEKTGSQVLCYMADPEIAEIAAEKGCTRAWASVEKAASVNPNGIFVVGNAPTALIRIYQLVRDGVLTPRLIVGTPVGFVNVEASKELIRTLSVPHIIAMGRKGGSNVAAAICNALLYQL